jgi:hypothetical protein
LRNFAVAGGFSWPQKGTKGNKAKVKSKAKIGGCGAVEKVHAIRYKSYMYFK